MDNHRLKHIIQEIQKKEGFGLAEIAANTGLDRSCDIAKGGGDRIRTSEGKV
jgi:hypothetical protein